MSATAINHTNFSNSASAAAAPVMSLDSMMSTAKLQTKPMPDFDPSKAQELQKHMELLQRILETQPRTSEDIVKLVESMTAVKGGKPYFDSPSEQMAALMYVEKNIVRQGGSESLRKTVVQTFGITSFKESMAQTWMMDMIMPTEENGFAMKEIEL